MAWKVASSGGEIRRKENMFLTLSFLQILVLKRREALNQALIVCTLREKYIVY